MNTTMDTLNKQCFCVSLDEDRLARSLDGYLGNSELQELLRERCPHVYSAHPVFVSSEHMNRMARLVAAIESVVALPAWHEAVLGAAPAVARKKPLAQGVFFGYDFHAASDSFGLIEINTNAGGAMLNAVVARAHRACCTPVAQLGPTAASADAFESDIVAMFRTEWARAGNQRPLRSIAVVDEQPAGQYLYPEFLLFQRLFESRGLQAVIADPQDLSLRDGALFAGGLQIDIVYNRLTDFYFEAPSSAMLKQAWLTDAAVITPHPQAHALYADKRNLVLLSDENVLCDLGVPALTRDVLLDGIPRTVIVGELNAQALWQARKSHFFKPFAGFGSRAAYRGDKLTQKVWSEIVKGGYVAQALVAPGERAVDASEGARPLKFDLRQFVHDGRIQWTAARLYQGQTTNFRTEGGGFAPVYEIPAEACGDDAVPYQASCSDQSVFCQATDSSLSR